MAMAGLLSLDQAQMVGLIVVWVCVVVGGWLFFGNGKVDCAVCGVFFSSMYYFFGVDILFYYSRYIILL